jgi:uncharacterized protein (UPF0264 family)
MKLEALAVNQRARYWAFDNLKSEIPLHQTAGIIRMTKLLVSVRDHHEALAAMSAGADIIDVKEPTRGSLGAADGETVRNVIDQINNQLPVSMACGELSQLDKTDLGNWNMPVRYAKIGMSEYRNRTSWLADWSTWCQSLSLGTQPIAVAYADAALANSRSPLEIISLAAQVGCVGVLIDTFSKKKSRSLLDYCSAAEVITIIQMAHENSLFVAVAGSLDRKSIPKVLDWGPDIIAVRGAACDKNRLGRIDGRKVQRLAAVLASPTNAD